ncbi:MAG TPA: TolC family protein [Bryobacteraceae bacterium]|nr:TolC family protein [Bryobacteraceae bacterium]
MKLKSIVILLLAGCGAYAQVAPPPQAPSNGPAPILRQPFQANYGGSVMQGQATPAPLPLTLLDAIKRGLQYNLGVLTNRDAVASARAERRRSLSALLPNLSVGATQTSQQIDLAAFGFSAPGFPRIVGPFGYQNVRAFAQQTVYDRTNIKNLKSAEESQKAAELNSDEARNLVVQAVSNAYLSVITDAARVEAIQAEMNTAQALFDRARDQKQAGVVPAIDVLRAEVQLRTEQQRLLAQTNQVEKDKLVLARAIGLPSGQVIALSDRLPFAPLQTSRDELLKQAYENRPDFRAAQANMRAAQFAIDAARSEHYWPSVVVQADYGDIGNTLAGSHGTYSVVAGVRVPIYAGGRAKADVDQAEAVLRNSRNVMEDVRGRIDYDVRNALLDLESAEAQVNVARTNVDLANQTLAQARDRFAAGVTDTIEVVQAQQLLASANENYIGALGAHNAAKIALATAVGIAEDRVPQYLSLH